MVHLKAQIERFNERQPGGVPPLDQQRLAEAVGITPSQVSRHVTGSHQMTFESAAKYAGFFGVRVADIDDRFSDPVELATLATSDGEA